MSETMRKKLVDQSSKLMDDLKRHANRKETNYMRTGRVVHDEFYPKYSKSIIDEKDYVLSGHYGFTYEELI